jgi:Transposase domain (DUF772)
MFAFLAGHRAEVFPDEDYADLFAPPWKGRPSVPATQMAAVLTLQALHGYSDRKTAEAVRLTCSGRRRSARRWTTRGMSRRLDGDMRVPGLRVHGGDHAVLRHFSPVMIAVSRWAR